MTITSVRDTGLYVERAGEGPELLFVHGMCGDASVWADQVRRLADRFTCITYDRRGHSRSGRGTAPESVETHAADAVALIETLALERPVLVGSSGGARIGVEVARSRPDLLGGAVLSEPPLFGIDPEAGAAFLADVMAAVGPAVQADDPRAAVDAFFPLVCGPFWAALDEPGRDRLRANGHMMLEEFAGAPYRVTGAGLTDVEVPCLVVSGTESHPSLRAFAAALVRALPDVRSVTLAGAGHVTYADRPAEFAGAVADFAGGAAVQARRPRSSRRSRTSAFVDESES